jgi:hypothetical protein
MEKGRIVFVLVLVVAGTGLLAYGLSQHAIAVWPKSPAAPEIPALDGEPIVVPVVATAQAEVVSEPVVTQEVARGGVTRDEAGRITKTYEGTAAPKACPT